MMPAAVGLGRPMVNMRACQARPGPSGKTRALARPALRRLSLPQPAPGLARNPPRCASVCPVVDGDTDGHCRCKWRHVVLVLAVAWPSFMDQAMGLVFREHFAVRKDISAQPVQHASFVLPACRLIVCKGGSRQGEAESNGTESNVRPARGVMCI